MSEHDKKNGKRSNNIMEEHHGLREKRSFNIISRITSFFGGDSNEPTIDIGKNILKDCRNRQVLPGRTKGDDYIEIHDSGDKDIQSVWHYTKLYMLFLENILQRNGLDGKGGGVTSNVHFGRFFNNAFFDGEQMVYGDGDGFIFSDFASDPSVVFHELTHGLIMHTCNLVYQGEPGALNESIADIVAICCLVWMDKRKKPISWLIGDLCMLDNFNKNDSLRSISNPGTGFVNHPIIGTDPQTSHMDEIYVGTEDNGGVHINSGISNRAFYLFCESVDSPIYDIPLKIWWEAMNNIGNDCTFMEFASATLDASSFFGTSVRKSLFEAWGNVGIVVEF
jgi:Zn-dependent metalloprotease